MIGESCRMNIPLLARAVGMIREHIPESRQYMLRNLAMELLDDEHGITQEAWEILFQMLERNGDQDIIDAVTGSEGRVYLRENHGITA